MAKNEWVKDILKEIEEREREIKDRLNTINKNLEKMKDDELNSFLGLKSDIDKSEWAHPSLSGSQIINIFRKENKILK